MEHLSTKEKMKGMTSKEKREYIWEYYKLPIFGTIISIFIISLVGYYILTYKSSALNILFTATSRTYDYEKIENDLSNELLSGNKKEMVSLSHLLYGDDKSVDKTIAQDAQSSNMTNDQKIAAMFYAKEIDVFIGEKEHFDFFAKQGGFYEITKFSEINVTSDKLVTSSIQREGNAVKPYAISIEGIPYFEKILDGNTKNLVLAIAANSQNLDKVKEFLTYIFNYK